MNALHHSGNTFEAHAGVNRRFRQCRHFAVRGPVKLHEYEIPDLDVTIAVLIGRSWWSTRNVRTMVVEDLATGSARPRVTHGPEIVFLTQTQEMLRVDLHFLQPDIGGLIIVIENGRPKSVGWHAQCDGQKLPGIVNCIALEVITEAEVSEHLEKSVVSRGVANVLEVIVFTARANTTLRGRGTIVVALLRS